MNFKEGNLNKSGAILPNYEVKDFRENLEDNAFFLGTYESTKRELAFILGIDGRQADIILADLFGHDHAHERIESHYDLIDLVSDLDRRAMALAKAKGVDISTDKDEFPIKLVANREIIVVANGREYRQNLAGIIRRDDKRGYVIIPWYDVQADEYEIIFPPIKEIIV